MRVACHTPAVVARCITLPSMHRQLHTHISGAPTCCSTCLSPAAGCALARVAHPRVTPSAFFLQAVAYSHEWRVHVLTHLPFYGVLVPQLLALCCARLALQGDVAAVEALLLLQALRASGPGLLQELRAAERAYNRWGGACCRS